MCKTCVSLFGSLVLAQTIGITGFLAYFFRQNPILSRARLPIPPQGHGRQPERFTAMTCQGQSFVWARYFLSVALSALAVALP